MDPETAAQPTYTDSKAAYDAQCKKVLSQKIVLAWIMKSCLAEYKDCAIDDIVEKYIEGQPQVSSTQVLPEAANPLIRGADTADKSQTEGSVLFDICFYALAPGGAGQIQLIINLEMQNDFYPGYPLTKRGMYYASRLLSSQYNREFTKSQYGKLKKVYSIWICTDPPKKRRNTFNTYSIEEHTHIGNAHEKREYYDLLSVILLCLGGPEDKNYAGILQLLELLLYGRASDQERQERLREDFQITSPELEKEASAMCNLSEGVERRGIAKGRAEGRIEGRAEGTQKSLEALTKTTHISWEQAMDLLQIPANERHQYKEPTNES